MRKKITCACRGESKAYIEMLVGKLPPESKLTLSAKTSEGRTAPAQLYETDENKGVRRIVLAFPTVSRRIKLALSETRFDGTTKTVFKITVYPSLLKWVSRLNYRLKGEICKSLRAIDQSRYNRHASFLFDSCVPSDGENILRMSLLLPSRIPLTKEEDYRLTLFDDNFETISAEMMIMHTELVPKKVSVPIDCQRIDYSIRMPQEHKSCTLYFEDLKKQLETNFATLDTETYAHLFARHYEITMSASQDPGYPLWFDKWRTEEVSKKRQFVTKLAYAPLISIVVPLYKTQISHFCEMVQSVLDQTYHEFELLLINADPKNEALGNAIGKHISADKRIREIKLSQNKGISKNTLEGIKEAQGEYVAFLDHDDTLEADALFEYVFALNANSSIDLLYCDEDKILPQGQYGDPYFKPDFSLFLLREVNYICHFLMVRKSMLEKLLLGDERFDGAQDHHLILQAIEQGAKVHHVPKMLYHWRVTQSSTAGGTKNKPYADAAAKKAVEEHLERQAIKASVIPSQDACRFRVSYHVMDEPLISIIIPNKDNIEVLDVCIISILEKSTYTNFEIVIIENNSTSKETFAYYEKLLKRDARIRLVVWEHEFNFSKLMNFGVSKAKGDYLILLNNDIEVISAGWIETMLGICQQKEVGAVGAKLYYPDGTIQHAGVFVEGGHAVHTNPFHAKSNPGYFYTNITTREVSAVTGACLMTKKEVFLGVEGFDERFTVAFSDVDYCLKVRDKGYSIIFSPATELFHYESFSRGHDSAVKDMIRLKKESFLLHYKWPQYSVEGDPFKNINLNPDNQHYGLYARE